jgi:hypothetical protein
MSRQTKPFGQGYVLRRHPARKVIHSLIYYLGVFETQEAGKM